MIQINKDANKITIKGHANYSDKEDIVCASVSSIMYTTVNALLRFNEKAINYKDDKNIVTIEILDNSKESNILIMNMMSLFQELASQYPKNIKIVDGGIKNEKFI